MAENIRTQFVARANNFENIINAVAEASRPVTEDTDGTEVATLLAEQPDSPEKADVTNNIDNIVKVFDVIQFQTEAMCEYVRSSIGQIVTRLESGEIDSEEEFLPMILFVQDRLIKLHNQLDFFFSSFEEEDIKKGFSIARRSAQSLNMSEAKDKEKIVAFIRSLRSHALTYIGNVGELHNWLHNLLDLVDSELQSQGLRGFKPVEG